MAENSFPSKEGLSKLTDIPALSEHSTTPAPEQVPSLEETVNSLERELNIETSSDRLMESSLLIDSKFLTAEIITGNNHHPERFFGDEAWADWLSGRLAAKEYGKRPLTPEFIVQLHAAVAERSAPLEAGFLRRVGMIGGDYTNLGSPMTISHAQAETINSNPNVRFIPQPGPLEAETIDGKIEYPQAGPGFNGKANRALILDKVKELCDWYNAERISPNFDPYNAAAILQHRLISIHPFQDNNGRLSRLLMNWSLENDDLYPAVLNEPSDDLFSTEEEWTAQVMFGSQFEFARAAERKEALDSINQEDLPWQLGLEQQKVFYDAVYSRLPDAIKPTRETKDPHELYKLFWQDFNHERQAFNTHVSATSKISGIKINYERSRYNPKTELMSEQPFTQGGLIPESYIALVKSGQVLPESIRDSYFNHHQKLYRGGMSSTGLSDVDVCQMFVTYVGLGAGYQSLEASAVQPTSKRPVAPHQIAQAIENYNKLLADSYVEQWKAAGDTTAPEGFSPPHISRLTGLLSVHSSNGDHRGSPWVSTSTNESQARRWGTNWKLLAPADTQVADRLSYPMNGVVIESRAPLNGALQTFNQDDVEDDRSDIPLLTNQNVIFPFPNEREVLLAGGVDPNSISNINVFDSTFVKSNTPQRVATPEIVDGQLHVIIKDYDSNTIKNYHFDSQAKQFNLNDEEAMTEAESQIEYVNSYIRDEVEWAKGYLKFSDGAVSTLEEVTNIILPGLHKDPYFKQGVEQKYYKALTVLKNSKLVSDDATEIES